MIYIVMWAEFSLMLVLAFIKQCIQHQVLQL